MDEIMADYHLLVIHGPNLNLLGQREPNIYGTNSLTEINNHLQTYAAGYGVQMRFAQSNHEGELITWLQDAPHWAQGVIFNPGGYSHTSIALRDAVSAIAIPVIEVHISNIYQRELFRQNLVIAPVCQGHISGFGWQSYLLAIDYFLHLWNIISTNFSQTSAPLQKK